MEYGISDYMKLVKAWERDRQKIHLKWVSEGKLLEVMLLMHCHELLRCAESWENSNYGLMINKKNKNVSRHVKGSHRTIEGILLKS